MRVLFVSTPGIGHAFPMVSLAWALRAAGHEVLFATGADALAVRNAGLQVVDIAPGLTMRDLFARVHEEQPELVERMRSGQLRDVRLAITAFGRIASHLADGVVEAAEDWRPDLVVYSQFQGTGPLAAAKLGVPAVGHGFGFARAEDALPLLHEHMTDAYDRHGVAAPPRRHATIDVAPPSMLGGEPHGWSMRYVPYNGGAVLPEWLVRPAERPRIAVTLGTVVPRMSGLGPVERIVAAARHVDAEFVLALGNTDTGALGELPDNVRPVGWTPLGALLRTCAAAVHHGGAGTTLTVLDAGVPQLVVPDGADRYINAHAVTERGAGLTAEADAVDPDLLGELLGNDKLRRATAEVRAEMAAMPAPAALVPRLETLAAG
ncbi:nucleotide disphospho-sugar-binding domain-containing protein [Gandjariella thermophila]|uniref:Glycosyl transferase n=1 Tax=Gandjariella thermophila TaxID=1931992 RepID=A0A4D4JEL5_9PSEU|nr:nucleotide disphospho-sugar-binding domain-containing protein [Gandjariella thermophila]GDY32293.1 glycosyl transferase [Gandjariella thermophila]